MLPLIHVTLVKNPLPTAGSPSTPQRSPTVAQAQVAQWRDRLAGFRAKVPMELTFGRFTLRTVQSSDELLDVLRLRHDVFYEELLGRDSGFGLDVDEFDPICDHLVIRRAGACIATYRMISSTFSSKFYTATEFDISQLTALPSTKLEVGRGCVHSDYRDGFTMMALWKGLAEYLQRSPHQFMFGCSSVKTTEIDLTARICAHLADNGHFSAEFHANPIGSFIMPGLPAALATIPPGTCEHDPSLAAALPPLLAAYLKAGAKVCGLPAIDRDFDCVDFFTVLRTGDLRQDLVRKYRPW